MRTFYRDDQVRITSSAFHVDGHRYPLEDLDGVWRARHRLGGRRVLIGLGVLLAAIAFTALVRYTWWFGGLRRQVERWLRAGPASVAAVGFLVLLLAVLGVVAVEAGLIAIEDIRGHARELQLWASIRGEPVLLLSTNDRDRFGQVCRALVRARAAGG
jgi:hypothetical protein